MGKIVGFCYFYIGQEVVVIGMQVCLKDGDQVIIGYCDYGYMLVCDMDLCGVMVELIGWLGGLLCGKGGLMYMFSCEKNFFGGYGIVGVQVLFGIGLVFFNKYFGCDNVCFVYFGDGVVNQGQVYEVFNMVLFWDLFVVYVIENNMYVMGMSVECYVFEIEFYKCGILFEIEGEEVDGMDVYVVKKVGECVVKYVCFGKGLYIFEMKIYCYCGYFMLDLVKYCKCEEVDDICSYNDLIDGLKEQIFVVEFVDEVVFKVIDKEIWVIVKDVVDFLFESLEFDLFELWIDVLLLVEV